MRFVTYNVWMDWYAQRERFRALLEILAELDPDVVALQEVTGPLLPMLAESPWAARYRAFPPPGTRRPRYFALLFGRGDFAGRTVHPFELTRMDREVVVGGAGPWTVATTHLESLAPSAPLRAVQLAECFARAPSGSPAALMGDMNLMDGVDGEPELPPGWIDAWLAAGHAHADGLTYDGDLNPLATDRRQRLDRVFLRLGERWRLRAVERIGTREVSPGLWPSDHFGLVCDVEEVLGP